MFQELLSGMDSLGDIFHKNCYLHFIYILSLFMSFSIALDCQGFCINRNFPFRLPPPEPCGRARGAARDITACPQKHRPAASQD